MLVYGDRQGSADPRALHAAIAARLAQVAAMPPGLARHAALAAALIEAGELAQGIADAEFAERGMDEVLSRRTGRWRCCWAAPRRSAGPGTRAPPPCRMPARACTACRSASRPGSPRVFPSTPSTRDLCPCRRGLRPARRHAGDRAAQHRRAARRHGRGRTRQPAAGNAAAGGASLPAGGGCGPRPRRAARPRRAGGGGG